jgi:hypothetical protein
MAKQPRLKEPMRTVVAKLTGAYWDACILEAAKVHPNWTVEQGQAQRLGGRGPRTPLGLLNWFTANHWPECERIRDRIAAKHKFASQDAAGSA